MSKNKKVNYFKEFAPLLVSNGYNVVPIAKGCKFPKGFGKWQSRDFNKQVKELSKFDNGVGIKTGHGVVAVDVDVSDFGVSNQLTEFIIKLVGATPIRTGKKPKVALLFQGDFKKQKSAVFEDFINLTHHVEILGAGQQIVTHAIHPETHNPYSWENGDIADIHKSKLPRINQNQINQIFEEAENLLKKAGMRLKENRESVNQVKETDPFLNLKKPINISTHRVKKTLEQFDPDCHHDKWVKVGMALYHQFNGSDEGFQIFDDWSAKGTKYNPHIMREKWASFKADINSVSPITFATMLKAVSKAASVTKVENTRHGFSLVKAGDILKKLGPIDWLIDGVLEGEAFGVMFGDPGSYKSFLALDMALHIATGIDYNGKPVKQGMVIFFNGEGNNGVARRIASWQKEHGVDLNDYPIYFSTTSAPFLDVESMTGIIKQVDEIAQLEGVSPELVVVDTLARNFGPGDENSTADMGEFIRMADIIKHEFTTTVMAVHHTGRGDKNRTRGSIALDGGADFIYQVTKDTDLHCRVKCLKMKDAPEPEEMYFKGKEVMIDMTEKEEITSLVFEQTDAPVSPVSDLKGGQKLLYKLIQKHAAEDGRVDRKHVAEMAVLENLYKNENGVRVTINRLAELGWVDISGNEIIDLGVWDE